MGTPLSWVGEALTRFHLCHNKPDDSVINRYRLIVDRAALIERVFGTCHVINTCAHEGIVYGETFARPHPIVFRIGFVRGAFEYLMTLAIVDAKPTLIFSSRRENPWIRSVLRHHGHFLRRREDCLCKLLVNPAMVNDGELQQWFTYLLSGLKRPFKPAKDATFQHVLDLSRTFPSQESV